MPRGDEIPKQASYQNKKQDHLFLVHQDPEGARKIHKLDFLGLKTLVLSQWSFTFSIYLKTLMMKNMQGYFNLK